MTWYHGTSEENWKAIQEEGVLFGRRYITDNDGNIIKELSRCTYLALDIEEAKQYGNVILEVKYNPLHENNKDKNDLSLNNFVAGCWQIRVYEPIDIKNIKRIYEP